MEDKNISYVFFKLCNTVQYSIFLIIQVAWSPTAETRIG